MASNFMLVRVYAFRGTDRTFLGEFASVEIGGDGLVTGHPGSYRILRRSGGTVEGRGDPDDRWMGTAGEIYDRWETTTVTMENTDADS